MLEKNFPAMKISSDQGRTWKTCDVPESNGMVQPDLIQLAPKSFVLFFRSRFADWVYKSTSADGCQWTTPVATQIPNNNASIQVERLTNGHLVIAFNNTQATQTRGEPGGAFPACRYRSHYPWMAARLGPGCAMWKPGKKCRPLPFPKPSPVPG